MTTADGNDRGAVGGTAEDAALKARHRKMWASGDYPSMVETLLLAVGTRH